MVKLVKEDWVIWVDGVDRELQRMERSTADWWEYWRRQSIYRLPARITDENKKAYNAYKPQAVSFGPCHHGQEDLQPMEEHKSRALLHFLKRSNKPLGVYIKALHCVVEDLMYSYGSVDAWEQDIGAFLKMMILDGCFMLEIMHQAVKLDDNSFLHDDNYASNDPVFSVHGKKYIMPIVKRDMLMIENQLPMVVLLNLLAVQSDNEKDEAYVNWLILKFFSRTNQPASIMGKCLHVLDLFRKHLILEVHHHYNTAHRGMYVIIRSATELNEAGIRFRSSKTASLKDVSFHNGVLRLPPIIVDDSTESMFLNLIAFERFHVGAGNEVTVYISFMVNITKNAKDVALLISQNIIQCAQGSDEDVAKLFNTLSKDITAESDSHLNIVREDVFKYCFKPWNAWRANLIQTYFRNPWVALSILGAIFLFVLTIIQTIYTVYSAYK